MAKQYNTKRAAFNQSDYEKVARFLSDELKRAFKDGAIDLSWCKTFCIPYACHLIKNGQYDVGQEYRGKGRGRGNKKMNKHGRGEK